MNLVSSGADQVIVIDGSVFSTEAHDRGMGRYVSFLMQVLKRAGFKICLTVYQKCYLEPQQLRALSCDCIENIHLDLTNSGHNFIHEATHSIAEIIRKYKASAFIDATPFVSPNRFDITECPVIVVAYDLIPLKNPSKYLYNEIFDISVQYKNSLRRFNKADFIIAISETTKEEIKRYLGVPDDRITCIYPCLSDDYLNYPLTVESGGGAFGILGGHYSKNPELIIKIFSQLAEDKSYRYTLCVPTLHQLSSLRYNFPNQMEALSVICSISEDRKIRYQKQADVIFHLSREEGFGIPLLEALFFGRRVICCDTKINREILGKGVGFSDKLVHLIDEHSYDDNATRFFAKQTAPDEISAYYISIRKYFIKHWNVESVHRIEFAIKQARNNYEFFMSSLSVKMASNTPVDFCGVADYAYHLCNGTKSNLVVYTNDSTIDKISSLENIRIKTHYSFYDDEHIKIPTIFHFAVSDRLWFGIDLLWKYGKKNDILILHDNNAFYGIYYQYISLGKIEEFLERYFLGSDQALKNTINRSNLLSSQEFSHVLRDYKYEWLKRKGIRIISHLTDASERNYVLRNDGAIGLPKEKISIGVMDLATPEAARIAFLWRRRHAIGNQDVVIGVFGSVTSNKMIVEIASAVADAFVMMKSKMNHGVHFVLCGPVFDPLVFNEAKMAFVTRGIGDRFFHEVPSSETGFNGVIGAADIIISCRIQDRGQLSHIIPRALALGKPILTNSGSGYSMLSDGFVIDDNSFGRGLVEKLLCFIGNRRVFINEGFKNRQKFCNEYNASEMFAGIMG